MSREPPVRQPIAGGPTAITAIVGTSARRSARQPRAVHSSDEFDAQFGPEPSPLGDAVRQFFAAGGTHAIAVATKPGDAAAGLTALETAGPFGLLCLADPAGRRRAAGGLRAGPRPARAVHRRPGCGLEPGAGVAGGLQHRHGAREQRAVLPARRGRRRGQCGGRRHDRAPGRRARHRQGPGRPPRAAARHRRARRPHRRPRGRAHQRAGGQRPARSDRGGTGHLGRAHARQRRRLEVRLDPAPRAVPRAVARPRAAVGRLRAQRRAAVGARAQRRGGVPVRTLAGGHAARQPAGGGVLRQVRSHDDDPGRHRRRPARRRRRLRRAEAGGVRDPPHGVRGDAAGPRRR